MRGDREAYAELVRSHHPRVIRLCAFLLSDPVAGEDAAQEVFLKAYRQLSGFRGDAAFSTWLTRIAYHHCADILRSRARRPTEPLNETFADPLPSPVEAFISAESLQKTLGALPEESREILLLREVEGLTYEEIAETLDCTLDAVKSRLRRARLAFLQKARSL